MLDTNKLLYVIVTCLIVIYLGVGVTRNFDFSKVKDLFNTYLKEFSVADIYKYLDNHKDYYYEIEDSVYCITKEELIASGEISDKFINNMPGNIIEATYKNKTFNIEYNESCVER